MFSDFSIVISSMLVNSPLLNSLLCCDGCPNLRLQTVIAQKQNTKIFLESADILLKILGYYSLELGLESSNCQICAFLLAEESLEAIVKATVGLQKFLREHHCFYFCQFSVSIQGLRDLLYVLKESVVFSHLVSASTLLSSLAC